MPKCDSCQAEVNSTDKFCASCGAAIKIENSTDDGYGATRVYSKEEPKSLYSRGPGQRSSSAGPGSSPSGMETSSHRFPPGTILGERFRIVGPLGKGGMGEVYRADDLKLAQSVALKFLPENLTQDPERLELLYNEVRLARSVSHPNVCRVYDIGEIEGQHFLSMEFIDGEDLSSLLRRIGRLPGDKGVDIARQICSGLYAAHERGVIHLDLKPSNIMIDGRGKVRITDFGLARLTMTSGNQSGMVGTPAYMAPEQLAGGGVGEHSDIFALGLIFHEIFTGKPVFRASSIAEMIRIRDQSAPSRISAVFKDLDPVVNKIIQRCLDNDPAQRPANVVQIAAALPGGDPLAAAVAAGETPSPELIAASGNVGGIKPRWALLLLSLFFVSMAVCLLMVKGASPLKESSFDLKPPVLEHQAKDFCRDLLGIDPASVQDSAFGYWYNPDTVPNSANLEQITEDRSLEFWYRQSPSYLSPNHPFLYARQPRQVTLIDPAPISTGMAGVRLNGNGQLREICVVPSLSMPTGESESEVVSDEIWDMAFKWAGFHFEDFEPTPCQWTPPWNADKCYAWQRKVSSDGTNEELRIEAASLGGTVCYFQVIQPWTTRQWTLPSHTLTESSTSGKKVTSIGELAQDALFFLVGGPLLVISMILAIRNVKLGSTDYVGALKFAAFQLIVDFLLGVFESHHNSSFGFEVTTIMSCLINSLGRTARFWIYYLALEPFVRKTWPKVLVSWNRLLNGKFTDPFVSKEILIGCVLGAVGAAIVAVTVGLDDVSTQSMNGRSLCKPEILSGGQFTIAGLLEVLLNNGRGGVWALLVIVVFRLITRSDALAIVTYVAYYTVISSGSGDSWLGVALTSLLWLLTAIVVLKFGLLAVIIFFIVQWLITSFPITFNPDDWFLSIGLIGILIPVSIAIATFFFAMGDNSPLRTRLEPDV